jgi:transcriptional regulator with XRE-family HTH domain
MSKTVSYAQWSLEPYCLGLKLRSLRNGKRLTLSRLAAETGLSTALLSKLETDRMIPTLPTLAKIARVYGVSMGYFFAEPARHTLSITRKASLHANGRTMEAVKVTPLNADGRGFRLVARMVELPSGGSTIAINAFKETGAVIFVLEGRLKLDVGGMNEVLDTGDCACMESDMPLA